MSNEIAANETGGSSPRPPSGADIQQQIAELVVAVKALSQLRSADLDFARNVSRELSREIDHIKRSLADVATRADLTLQINELRQRLSELQSMEQSLRESSLAMIRSSFQSEAKNVEEKISSGSEKRYGALDAQIVALKTAIDSQSREVKLQIEGVVAAKVIQGIVWGIGIVAAMVGAVAAIIKIVN